MRPKERRDSGQSDLFRAWLDQIVDMHHPLEKLGRVIDRGFLEERFGAVYSDAPGHPPLPTRLMAGLAIFEHMYDLSDEVLCERWVETPLKSEYSMGRSHLAHQQGDAVNVILAAAGHNFRHLPAWLALLLSAILIAFAAQTTSRDQPVDASSGFFTGD